MIEVRGSFGRDFQDLQREMERLLGHLEQGKRPLAILSSFSWSPAVDVYQTAEEVVVLVEVAGVSKDDVSIVVDGHTLLLRGERLPRVRSQCHRCHQIEIGFGSFERAIDLPATVDPDRTTAFYDNGFLEIVMPKQEFSEGRRVEIKASNPR